MKRSICLVVLSLALLTQPLFAVQKTKSVTTNPFSLLLGITNAELNYGLSANTSFTSAVSFWAYDDSSWDYSLFSINLGYRYYWKGSAVNGWYLGPLLGFSRITADYEQPFTGLTADTNASTVNYGGLVGYQSIWSNSVTLDCAFGMQMLTIPSVDVSVGGSEVKSDELSISLPIIKVAVGYAFD